MQAAWLHCRMLAFDVGRKRNETSRKHESTYYITQTGRLCIGGEGSKRVAAGPPCVGTWKAPCFHRWWTDTKALVHA